MMRGGFPNIQWTLEETIAEDDKIAARFTMRGTHKGTFYRVPPTGKKIEVKAMNIYRFSNGKIREEHGQPGYCNKSARCRRKHALAHVLQSRTSSV
jgi:predicted ester cyclase